VLVEAAGALGSCDDEAGPFEHSEVLGHRRPAHGQTPRDLGHGQGPAREALEDGATRAVSQSVQLAAEGFWLCWALVLGLASVSHHLR